MDLRVRNRIRISGSNIFHQRTIASMVVVRQSFPQSLIHGRKPSRAAGEDILLPDLGRNSRALEQRQRVREESYQQ